MSDARLSLSLFFCFRVMINNLMSKLYKITKYSIVRYEQSWLFQTDMTKMSAHTRSLRKRAHTLHLHLHSSIRITFYSLVRAFVSHVLIW
jgi:hypothetical protein